MASPSETSTYSAPPSIEKVPSGEYPLIDNDPHVTRVFSYARPMDWVYGAGLGSISPALMLYWEKVSPSFVGRGGFAPIMRASGAVGVTAMVVSVYSRSCYRFYGATENKREVDMDMREMVDKVKRGEPLYGVSGMTEYMQGVSHRNSRYAATFAQVILWPNFTHHPYHGVDTAKYYRQAELELEAERQGKGGS
ncbi:NADH-ubiquinone oxidoreductase-like protein 21 kDa subunit [Amniculicola lignicola CBS 123094]|uniref:NADH-ubiquinone oxidoreductase-like protein 21 kDa subunit n=1 Tax=Amniculicola lignicola CBS 123094 TaxID=1392246 RepID=A0A6A5WGP4_9PLEO|nr:NADH-ubiquinone oxidoreductase-like protein 21 kDa subunit [Amniculicola lignicola CBS 123094]